MHQPSYELRYAHVLDRRFDDDPALTIRDFVKEYALDIQEITQELMTTYYGYDTGDDYGS